VIWTAVGMSIYAFTDSGTAACANDRTLPARPPRMASACRENLSAQPVLDAVAGAADNWRRAARPAQLAFVQVAAAIAQFEPLTVGCRPRTTAPGGHCSPSTCGGGDGRTMILDA